MPITTVDGHLIFHSKDIGTSTLSFEYTGIQTTMNNDYLYSTLIKEFKSYISLEIE